MEIIILGACIVLPVVAAEIRVQPIHGDNPERSAQLGEAIVLETSEEPRLRTRLRSLRAHKASNSVVAKGATNGFAIDTTDRLEAMMGFHQYHGPSENMEDQIAWTGSITSCNAGTISAEFHDAVLRRINYFRAQAGLTSDIHFDPIKNTKCQQAALVMSREKNLSHTPLKNFPNNPCVTAETDQVASVSNLALGSYGPRSIDRLIKDDGAINAVVGHRRWFFNPRVREMGHGSLPTVPNYASSCVVWVIGDFIAPPEPQAVAWPNEGYCPYLFVPGEDESYPRWSFSYPGADFTSAQVSMTYEGAAVTGIVIETVVGNLADNTIVWRPPGISSSPPAVGTDSLAEVTISGIQNAPFSTYSYQVKIFDPYDLQETLTVTGPEQPSVHGNSVFAFNSISGAEGYQLRVAQKNSDSWTEGAENSTADRVIDQTSSSYALRTTALASSGTRSFHMVFPEFGEQGFELDRSVIPSADSVLRFNRRFRFMFPSSRLKAEISKNDGASWITIYDVPGNNSSGSSTRWENSWVSINEPIPAAYVGAPIRVRFRIETNGEYFQWTSGQPVDYYGVFLDDISISNSSEVINESLTSLDDKATSFVFSKVVAGGTLLENNEYFVQLAPIVGGHQFGYTAPLVVSLTSDVADEAEVWQIEKFGSVDMTGDMAPGGDFDKDGVPNLIERALGMDPTASGGEDGAKRLPHGTAITSGVLANRPVVHFSMPRVPPTDITYEIQQSQGSETWTPIARRVGVTPWDTLGGESVVVEGEVQAERVEVQVGGKPIVSGEPPLQLRLEVRIPVPGG